MRSHGRWNLHRPTLYISGVLRRFSWYLTGVASGFYLSVALYRRARALRRKVTPETMLRAAGLTVADILESVSARVDHGAGRVTDVIDDIAGTSAPV